MNEGDLWGPELREAIEQSGLTISAYARELGIPSTTLKARMKMAKPPRLAIPKMTKEQAQALMDEYKEPRMSIRLLGDRHNLSSAQMQRRLQVARDITGDQWTRPRGANKTAPVNRIDVEENETVLTTRWVESLDDLFDIFDVDLDIWHPYRHVVNYWGSPTHPNTQVKAWLEMKEPLALLPVVSPITLKLPKFRRVPKPARSMLRVLNIPDAHVGFRRDFDTGTLVPFHDRLALDIVVQVARREQPDVIVIKGDWLDMTEWTDKYPRSPEFFMTTQPAAIEGAWWLAQFRLACPDAQIVFLKGNHENRLDRIMASHLAYAHKMRKGTEVQSHPLYSVYTWLDLAALDIEYVDEYPEGKYWANPLLAFMHGNVSRTKPGATARLIADKEQYSVAFDHIHRPELATRKVRTSQGYHYVYAFASGCLCHIDGRVPGAKDDMNCIQGFSMIDYLPDGKHNTPIITPIYEGTAYVDGKVFEGRDRVEELRKDSGFKSF